MKAGYYETLYGKYPKIKIQTIRELFEGKQPNSPFVATLAFKKAPKEIEGDQDKLPFWSSSDARTWHSHKMIVSNPKMRLRSCLCSVRCGQRPFFDHPDHGGSVSQHFHRLHYVLASTEVQCSLHGGLVC